MSRGRFITLEGGEGVGKSTLATSLKLSLNDIGISVLLTREPGGSIGGEIIRTLVLNPPQDANWSSMTQTLLFFAARRDHLERIILPALERGEWVICDRFSDSTRAYQSVASGVNPDIVHTLDTMVVGTHQPDLTLILDMELSQASARRNARNGPQDAFECLPQSFHENVRQAFLDIATLFPQRCHVIDASADKGQVATNAFSVITDRLGKL